MNTCKCKCKCVMAAAALLMVASAAIAKLPPPTPEQVQAAETKKTQEAANAEKQKILLEQAQNRVADSYRRTHGGSASNAGRGGMQVQSKDIPRAAVVPAGQAGPKGGTQQSAEAHSAPAK